MNGFETPEDEAAAMAAQQASIPVEQKKPTNAADPPPAPQIVVDPDFAPADAAEG